MTSEKRVGLIDNLSHIDQFVSSRLHRTSASEIMAATGGNTGNVAFVFGVRQILKNDMVRIGWGWDPDQVKARCDHLVICCANQIGKHTDLAEWADRLEQFNLPVTLVGLGAQADDITQEPEIPKGTLQFLHLVSKLRHDDQLANIAVRGEYTQRVLANIGIDSVAAGCPSLHISPEKDLGSKVLARQRIEGTERVAVAAGNPWHAASAHLERVLVGVVEHYQGEYVLQHPESMMQFHYGEREAISEMTAARFLHVYGERFDLDGLIDWFRRHSVAFADAPNWMTFMRKFDLVLGPRYHGVALGIQAGTPGCVVTIDSRTTELCDGTGVKQVSVSDLRDASPADVVEVSMWDNADAERLNQVRGVQSSKFVEFIDSNGLAASDHILSLANT